MHFQTKENIAFYKKKTRIEYHAYIQTIRNSKFSCIHTYIHSKGNVNSKFPCIQIGIYSKFHVSIHTFSQIFMHSNMHSQEKFNHAPIYLFTQFHAFFKSTKTNHASIYTFFKRTKLIIMHSACNFIQKRTNFMHAFMHINR